MGTKGNWKTKVLVVGGLVGALAGVGAAYMIIRRAEGEEGPPKIGVGEGLKLGLVLLGFLRQVSLIGQKEKE
jgi:hypothetical protein